MSVQFQFTEYVQNTVGSACPFIDANGNVLVSVDPEFYTAWNAPYPLFKNSDNYTIGQCEVRSIYVLYAAQLFAAMFCKDIGLQPTPVGVVTGYGAVNLTIPSGYPFNFA